MVENAETKTMGVTRVLREERPSSKIVTIAGYSVIKGRGEPYDGYGVGVNNIILLADLNDASKGYLVNDAIIFEAEMVKVTVTNIVSV
ncbi:hypothetical protein BRARA_B03592 [Brassica rapa]|uniref:Uncharacterized protein n=1 Tax=Brassica campestris TaxID=3711 RepID=A0A398AFQ7_BRACM|nr:hypothetical protein BRARA_B03592 [Brassica rapa]